MGVFDLLRDMEQDDVIEAISKKVQNVEARLEKLETLVRALDAKARLQRGSEREGSRPQGSPSHRRGR